MQTQTSNIEAPTEKASIIHIVIVSIVGSAVLFSGFIMSLFLLALSAILLPFMAFKVWLFQKQIKEHMQSSQNTDFDNSDIIEGEYIVTENSKDEQ